MELGGGGGAGVEWCYESFYPLPIAINTARFYTLLQSQYTARGDNTFKVN